MKKFKISLLVGVLMAVGIGLTACFWPEVLPEDPDPREVAPTAVFSYWSDEYPIQTGSRVLFDASDSFDADGDIVWAEWDLGDGTDLREGPWTEIVPRWENGVEVLDVVSVMREVDYVNGYDEVGIYTVELTIWDNDSNVVKTSRNVKISNLLD